MKWSLPKANSVAYHPRPNCYPSRFFIEIYLQLFGLSHSRTNAQTDSVRQRYLRSKKCFFFNASQQWTINARTEMLVSAVSRQKYCLHAINCYLPLFFAIQVIKLYITAVPCVWRQQRCLRYNCRYSLGFCNDCFGSTYNDRCCCVWSNRSMIQNSETCRRIFWERVIYWLITYRLIRCVAPCSCRSWLRRTLRASTCNALIKVVQFLRRVINSFDECNLLAGMQLSPSYGTSPRVAAV